MNHQTKPCNFCNNTDSVCCHEAVRTDNRGQIHIIDVQDEHRNNQADSHVFMMNGLLVAKDVVMPH